MTAALSPSSPSPVQLSSYLTEIPQQITVHESRKALLYSLVSKVCLAAFVAIAASVLSISIGLLMPIQPTVTFAMILSTLPLQIGFQSFMMKSLACSERANQAAEKAKELARIGHWKHAEIKAFFKEHKLAIENLPVDLLRTLTPKEPLRALLPAIAAYQYFSNRAKKYFDEHVENLHNEVEDKILHCEGRRHGWRVLEYQAIPSALQAALVLETIAHPTLQIKLDHLGTCQAKEFDQRRFDQLLDGTDEYFVFKDESKLPLTFAEANRMVSTQDIDGLREKLFAKSTSA